MKYAVRIEEILSKTVIVEEDDWESARDRVADIYKSAGIILTSDNFVDAEIDSSDYFGKEPISDDNEDLKYFQIVE